MRLRMTLALATVALLGCGATAMTVPRSLHSPASAPLRQPDDHDPLGYPPPRDTGDDGESNWCREDQGSGPTGQLWCV